MNYEVEVKYPLADAADFQARIEAIGGQFQEEVDQEDLYFGHPQRDFAATDEAFRIRRSGSSNRVTYKGPLLDKQTKSREEIEVGIADGIEASGKFERILKMLGFVPVHRVAKQRQIFELTRNSRSFEIVIDRVDGLGAYAEIETSACPDTFTAARDDVLALASELGIEAEVERRSYLRLLLEQLEK